MPKQVRHCPVCKGLGHLASPFEACEECRGTGLLEVRCNQCWRWKRVLHFIGALKGGKAKVGSNCDECRSKYKGYDKLSQEERALLNDSRKGLEGKGPLRVFFTLKSLNRKTGPIPVSMTSSVSCPPSCSYYGAGCYAERHILGMHWRRLEKGEGRHWTAFCDMVRELPKGQLWRHNEAGDLPGLGETLSESQIVELAGAARHTRGFTYTHKLGKLLPFLERENHFKLLRYLNASGVTVNLSVDNFDELDAYAGFMLPMTTVLAVDAPRVSYTKQGRKVIVCPAQVNEGTTCSSCGICQANSPDRAVVGFLAHGNGAGQISDRLTPKRQLPLFSEEAVSGEHRARVAARPESDPKFQHMDGCCE